MRTCPKCGVSLEGELIWEHFYREKGDKDAADQIASFYGATRTEGRWGRAISLYDRDKDRTVAYQCPDCNHKWERK
jgi:hypothetical protein